MTAAPTAGPALPFRLLDMVHAFIPVSKTHKGSHGTLAWQKRLLMYSENLLGEKAPFVGIASVLEMSSVSFPAETHLE